MFSHVLVPVDGSAASDRAVHTAVAMAKAFDGQVGLVSVMDSYPFSGAGADMAFARGEQLDAATVEAGQVIHRAREQCEASAVAVSSSVVEGPSVYAAIIEAAEAADPAGADFIVWGCHGLRGFEKPILGSVTAQVLSHSHVPVPVASA